jgi:dUTP pyrophosphatase
MKIHFKKLDSKAQKPKFGKPGDAGADLVATSVTASTDYSRSGQLVYGTGLAVEIPEGMVGLIFPRSSIRSFDLSLSNSVGVIDSGYRGEIMVVFNIVHGKSNIVDEPYSIYDVGDRIAQLVIMPVPLVQFVEVDELSETERGKGGYGSTGK